MSQLVQEQRDIRPFLTRITRNHYNYSLFCPSRLGRLIKSARTQSIIADRNKQRFLLWATVVADVRIRERAWRCLRCGRLSAADSGVAWLTSVCRAGGFSPGICRRKLWTWDVRMPRSAVGRRLSFRELLMSYVSYVWAGDNYENHPQILVVLSSTVGCSAYLPGSPTVSIPRNEIVSWNLFQHVFTDSRTSWETQKDIFQRRNIDISESCGIIGGVAAEKLIYLAFLISYY